MEVAGCWYQNILVVAGEIVSCSLVTSLQGKGPAPVGARLAPTLSRAIHSRVLRNQKE